MSAVLLPHLGATDSHNTWTTTGGSAHSYPLPTGGYVTEHVHVGAGGKRIRVRGIRREQPDVRKLMYALIEIAKDNDRKSRS